MLKNLRRRVSGTTIAMWIIGVILLVVVITGMVRTLMLAKYSAADWTDLFVYGISQGSVYALIALGYTMVYGILRMINFAHGDIFMAGAFFAISPLSSSTIAVSSTVQPSTDSWSSGS